MHQHRTRDLDKGPGRVRRDPSFEEACRVIGRGIDAVERAACLGEAQKESHRRRWARRRGEVPPA
jgi:hypothetical protein